MTKQTDALLPCPFCGGEPERITITDEAEVANVGGDVITCTKCDCSTRVFFGEKEGLVEAWNTRAYQQAQADAPALATVGGDADLFCGEGYVFHNPDTGWEYAANHPIDSGECPDASDIRRSTEQEDFLNKKWLAAADGERVKNINALVNRFLAWPLPQSVRSDLCVTEPNKHPRSGTNLLNANEARQMIEYLLSPGALVAAPREVPSGWNPDPEDHPDAGGKSYAWHRSTYENSPAPAQVAAAVAEAIFANVSARIPADTLARQEAERAVIAEAIKWGADIRCGSSGLLDALITLARLTDNGGGQ